MLLEYDLNHTKSKSFIFVLIPSSRPGNKNKETLKGCGPEFKSPPAATGAINLLELALFRSEWFFYV